LWIRSWFSHLSPVSLFHHFNWRFVNFVLSKNKLCYISFSLFCFFSLIHQFPLSYLSFILLSFCLAFSSFSWVLMWRDRILLRSSFSFIIDVYIFEFLFKHCFKIIPKAVVCCIFIFFLILKYCIIFSVFSLLHWLFSSLLFNFQIFVNFPKFFLLFISNGIHFSYKPFFIWFQWFWIYWKLP
jgi:hypothetical protein